MSKMMWKNKEEIDSEELAKKQALELMGKYIGKDFKNLSSSDKDELLYILLKIHNLL